MLNIYSSKPANRSKTRSKKMEGLKKRFYVEHDRFKVFLSLAGVVVGGFVGLLFRERDSLTITLIFLGVVVVFISFALAVRSFIRLNRLLKTIEETERHLFSHVWSALLLLTGGLVGLAFKWDSLLAKGLILSGVVVWFFLFIFALSLHIRARRLIRRL